MRRFLTYLAALLPGLLSAQLSWTSVNPALSATNPPRAVAFGGATFVTVGTAGTLYTSADGQAWVNRSIGGETDDFRAVGFGGGRWVAAGSNGTIYTSVDAITWTERVSGTGQLLRAVGYDGALLLVGGNAGTFLTSVDGVNWVPRTLPGPTGNLRDIAFGNGTYVTVTTSGQAVASTNLTAWTLTTLNANPLSGIAFGNGRFSAVGPTGVVYSSTDGLAWTTDVAPFTEVVNDIHFNGQFFIAAGVAQPGGNVRVWLSPDGRLFLETLGSAAINYEAVASGLGRLVAVGASTDPFSFGGNAVFSSGSSSTPVLYTQSGATTGAAGARVAIGVVAGGGLPLTYVWRKSGVVVDGATGPVLAFSSASPTDSGSYTVTVSNGFGQAVSQPIQVNITGGQAPLITSSAPPSAATAGQPYSHQLTATGVPAPTYAVTAGALPPGLTLSGAGAISGTPTAQGTFTGTITASNGVSPASLQAFSITVAAPLAAPVITSGAPPATATVNTAYSHTFTATGNPAPTFGVSTGTLPPGLSLAGTGQLSGTVTTEGSYTVTVTAFNGVAPAAFQTFTVNVVPLPVAPGFTSALPPTTATTGVPYSHTFAVTGAPAPTLSLTSGTLPAGLVFDPALRRLFGTPTAAGTFPLTFTASNGVVPNASQSFTLVISVPQVAPQFTSSPPATQGVIGAPYSHTFAATGSPAPTFSVTNGSLPPGLALNPTTGLLSGSPTTAGTFTGTVTASNGVNPAATQLFSIQVRAPFAAPVIVQQPASVSVAVGQTATFTVVVTGNPEPSFQWRRNGFVIPNAISASYSILAGLGDDNVQFDVIVGNTQGQITSAPATLRVNPAPVAPALTSALPPAGRVGESYSHLFTATGTPAPVIALGDGGTLPPGVTLTAAGGLPAGTGGATLSGTPTTAGTFTTFVRATNAAGEAVQTFTITIQPAFAAPAFTAQPADLVVAEGASATFTAVVTGNPPPSLQWRRNGTPIAGATGATLTLPVVTAADAGAYDLVATNPQGTATSRAAVLSLAQRGRALNVSTRADVGTAGDVLIGGFVLSGNRPKSLLIRAVGPALAGFNVPGFLANPSLRIVRGESTTVVSNDNWGSQAAPDVVRSAAAAVGAFALPEGSLDAAVVVTLDPGPYTAVVAGVGATTGVALVEIYDLEDRNAPTRLINLSTRARIGTGGSVAIAGFVVEGGLPRRFLIRGVGPALTGFGVSGVLPDPIVRLRRADGTEVASNDDWGSQPAVTEIRLTSSAVGAFALPEGGIDAALLVELPAGVYTVELSGSGGGVGVGLIEVYEVP